MQDNTMQNNNTPRNLIRIAIATAIILLIPLLGRWDWTAGDFVIMGVLLFGAGLIYELVTRSITKTKHRVAVGLAILFVFLLIWAELAVGIFGSPIAGS
jgi:hypothetical protein